jgi:formyl-CoA transferase/CoA:oxalate CoA-transferase
MKMPLEDVVVLDLSHALAGPHCSTMLADYGARVYKLETPGSGDIARAWGAPLPGGETSYFSSLHRNKKGLSIDLKTAEGKELFMRLAEKADVILENFRVGALEKLGLGYEAVRARNPAIVYCSVSGFGQDGPYRERAALDLILQAESGMISVTGEEGGSGVRCGVSIADLAAGMYAAYGIMLALRVKDKTGVGQRVDVSMLEGQLSLLNIMIASYMADRELPVPMGTAYKALLPYQTFRTQTRDLALAIGSQKLWKVFGPAIGRPDLVDDPRFATNRDRVANRAALVKSPVELLAGTIRLLLPEFSDTRTLVEQGRRMRHDLFNPPHPRHAAIPVKPERCAGVADIDDQICVFHACIILNSHFQSNHGSIFPFAPHLHGHIKHGQP